MPREGQVGTTCLPLRGWWPPPSTDPCMPSTLGSRSLSGLSGSHVCAAPVRADCGSPAWLVRFLLHLLIASGTGQRHQPLYSVRPLELRLPSLQQGESHLPETWERGPQSPSPFSPSPLTMATALHICMCLWPRWAP